MAGKDTVFQIPENKNVALTEALIKALLATDAKVADKLKMAGLSEKAQAAIEGAIYALGTAKDELPEGCLKMLADMAGLVYGAGGEPPAADAAKAATAKALENLPPEAKAKLEELSKAAVTAETACLDLEKRLNAEIEKRRTEEFIAKAAAIGGKLPIPTADLAAMLKAQAPEQAAKFETLIKTVNEIVSKSAAFSELGSSATGGAADAWGKIEMLAKAYKDKNPAVTIEKARVEVLKTAEGKALHMEYRKEQ